MAEASSGSMTSNGASPSTAEVKAAIRETRHRLSMRLAETSDQLHDRYLFPPSKSRERGVLGLALGMIGTAGRVRRVWSIVRRTGLLGRRTTLGMAVGVATSLAARARRRRRQNRRPAAR